MTIEKQVFRMYRNEEEISKDKAKLTVTTIRLNAEEQKILKELKQMFNLHTDGTAIKQIFLDIFFRILMYFFGVWMGIMFWRPFGFTKVQRLECRVIVAEELFKFLSRKKKRR